jgi:hypothetical protein|tara:strand:- start:884 stop:1036 length:153 start_codon:yes stop_codon:yes gene_type:complete
MLSRNGKIQRAVLCKKVALQAGKQRQVPKSVKNVLFSLDSDAKALQDCQI